MGVLQVVYVAGYFSLRATAIHFEGVIQSWNTMDLQSTTSTGRGFKPDVPYQNNNGDKTAWKDLNRVYKDNMHARRKLTCKKMRKRLRSGKLYVV